jgi:hypothetical protein
MLRASRSALVIGFGGLISPGIVITSPFESSYSGRRSFPVLVKLFSTFAQAWHKP